MQGFARGWHWRILWITWITHIFSKMFDSKIIIGQSFAWGQTSPWGPRKLSKLTVKLWSSVSNRIHQGCLTCWWLQTTNFPHQRCLHPRQSTSASQLYICAEWRCECAYNTGWWLFGALFIVVNRPWPGHGCCNECGSDPRRLLWKSWVRHTVWQPCAPHKWVRGHLAELKHALNEGRATNSGKTRRTSLD